AYVVGGYTGTRWLDTIVAWRPGGRARVVARLPSPVRYAAVAAAGRRIVIAGGSLPNGAASDAVLAFDPRSRHVVRLGRLPAATCRRALPSAERRQDPTSTRTTSAAGSPRRPATRCRGSTSRTARARPST